MVTGYNRSVKKKRVFLGLSRLAKRACDQDEVICDRKNRPHGPLADGAASRPATGLKTTGSKLREREYLWSTKTRT